MGILLALKKPFKNYLFYIEKGMPSPEAICILSKLPSMESF